MSNNVVLFRDYTEDGRPSMENYARNLATSLSEIQNDAFTYRDYRPAISCLARRIPEVGNCRMRFARYISYPFQAWRNQGNVNHIIDHAYAHLLYAIDPDRSVVTVHDLIPTLAWQGLIPGMIYPHKPYLFEFSLKALFKAAAIIAVSENTKKDLVRHCNIDESKIFVVYSGINACFQPLAIHDREALRNSFHFPADNTRIILITGTGYYKNHETCLRVLMRLNQLMDKPVMMVRLGRNIHAWQRLVVKKGLERQVVSIEWLPQDKLVNLFSCVDCLLFPSLYEGFGWPPIEAMACGTPVVTSNVASLPESVGDAALMAAPDDDLNLALAVKSLLNDEETRGIYVSRGLANVKRFSWSRCAEQVLDVYKNIALQA